MSATALIVASWKTPTASPARTEAFRTSTLVLSCTIVLRYLHLPERTAGFAVAAQGLAFVFTLVTAGPLMILHPRAGPTLGGCLVVAALVGLATSRAAAEIYLYALVLGCGLGLLQIINLTDFALLGETIGFSQAASINALAGPCGGVFGGLLGGLVEHWIAPQPLFLAFIPLFAFLALARPGKQRRLMRR
jgi:hypothetical protein